VQKNATEIVVAINVEISAGKFLKLKLTSYLIVRPIMILVPVYTITISQPDIPKGLIDYFKSK